MKIEAFNPGALRIREQYKSFEPSKVNVQWVWEDPGINVLLEDANRALGELNASARMVPEVTRFLRMHIMKEANSSSRIEGTRTEFDEVIQDAEDVQLDRRGDWQEVHNFINAMNFSVRELDRLPLSLRLLREAHRILLSGVRGQHCAPGEFRRSQNWLGGATLRDAAFVPPHHEGLMDLLGDLELFWHNQHIQVPQLVRCAITHYQFETIHPFLDGNGRIGRLLITLQLVSAGLLDQPVLFMSSHLEKHRAAYFDSLAAVRSSGDLGQWCRFFLEGIRETASHATTILHAILRLQEDLSRKVLTMGKLAPKAMTLIETLYERPLTTRRSAEKVLGTSYSTIRRLFQMMVEQGILVETPLSERDTPFLFEPYVALFR